MIEVFEIANGRWNRSLQLPLPRFAAAAAVAI